MADCGTPSTLAGWYCQDATRFSTNARMESGKSAGASTLTGLPLASTSTRTLARNATTSDGLSAAAIAGTAARTASARQSGTVFINSAQWGDECGALA